MENWTLKRRKDMVVKEKNVRALVSWLLTNNKVLAQHLDHGIIERLNKRLQNASKKTTDSEYHSSTSKAVIQLLPRDKWQRIRSRYDSYSEIIDALLTFNAELSRENDG